MAHRSVVVAAPVLGLCALLLTPTRMAAGERRIEIHGGGGVTFPVGAAGDRFKPGWHMTAGAAWRLDERLALQLDYGDGRHKVIGQSLPVGFVKGRHAFQHLDLDLRFTVNPRGQGLLYLLAGPSLVRRRVEIDDVPGYEPGSAICDPWLMVCEPAGATLRQVAGSSSSTDLGLNAGIGIRAPLSDSVRFFVESRWLLVRGQNYGLPGSASRRSGAVYLPLTFGLRFQL